MCVYKKREVSLTKMDPKEAQWDYFGPKLVACLPAFGTTTPIVKVGGMSISSYADFWCKWECAHSTEEGDKTKKTT